MVFLLSRNRSIFQLGTGVYIVYCVSLTPPAPPPQTPTLGLIYSQTITDVAGVANIGRAQNPKESSFLKRLAPLKSVLFLF